MILIIDGNNMAHRARYAYQLSYRGKDTSVTYGTLRMLASAIDHFRPDAVIMCFDGGVPLYRRQLVPSYKANRHHENDLGYIELVRQLEELLKVLPLFGVLVVRRRGIEADDLMYQASVMTKATCALLTGDEDLLQAVRANVYVIKPIKPKSGAVPYQVIDLDNFEMVTGLRPGCWMPARILIGDGSDNLQGCLGFGEKSAQKLFGGWDAPPPYPIWLNTLNLKMAARVSAFMAKGYAEQRQVADLMVDRTGARLALYRAPWQPFDQQQVQHYCFQNGFASLIENHPLRKIFGHLQQPKLDVPINMPKIWSAERQPQ